MAQPLRILRLLAGATAILALGLACKSANTDKGIQDSASPNAQNGPAPTGSSTGNETVHPIGPPAGGLGPVGGTDSVEGAGGGSVADAAKERAKKAASGPSSSLGQGGDDSSGN